jgi:hypothetical protein
MAWEFPDPTIMINLLALGSIELFFSTMKATHANDFPGWLVANQIYRLPMREGAIG